MVEIIWTEPALSDLNDIAEYIALENVVAAKQLVQTFLQKLNVWLIFQSLDASHQNWNTSIVVKSL
ncbi:plasmid stabilization system protein [marine sediment metagenome]|uniref:Plasmid stabilization system protein n=1 Tax=marine sediment metagenome TaxID=412755 RepID=A0A1B6NS05_9ZZZZ